MYLSTLQREQAGGNEDEPGEGTRQLPDILRRRFRVYFKPTAKHESRTIRSIRAADIGHLVTFKVCCVDVYEHSIACAEHKFNALTGHLYQSWGRETTDRSGLFYL